MKMTLSCCGISFCNNTAFLDARVSQNETGSLYEKFANVYDIWVNLTESNARNRAIERVANDDGQNIMEATVGTGLACSEIAIQKTFFFSWG